jgi:hypothetical protein
MLLVISCTNSCIEVTECGYCVFLHTNISLHPSSHDVNVFVAGGSGVENEKGGRARK